MVLVYEEVGETCQRPQKHRPLKLRGILADSIARVSAMRPDLFLDD